MPKRGMLIVLSGPSGVGKGTVRKEIFSREDNTFHYSVSMTTRKKRPGEVDGKDYFFVSKEEFEKEIENGGMLEYAKYVDNYYGTPLKYVNEMLDQGPGKSSGRVVYFLNTTRFDGITSTDH